MQHQAAHFEARQDLLDVESMNIIRDQKSKIMQITEQMHKTSVEGERIQVNMELKINQSVQRVNILNDQLNNQLQKSRELTAELQKSYEDVRVTQLKVNQFSDNLTKSKQENALKTEQINQLNNQLQTKNSQLQQLQQDNAQKFDQLEQLKLDQQKLNVQLKMNLDQIQMMNSNLQQLQNQLMLKNQDLMNLQKEINNKQNAKYNVKEQLENKVVQLNCADQEKQKTSHLLDQNNHTMQNLSQNINQLTTDCQQLRTNLQYKEEEVNALKQNVDLNDKEFDGKQYQILQLLGQIQQKDEEFIQKQNQAATLSSQQIELQDGLRNVQMEIDLKLQQLEQGNIRNNVMGEQNLQLQNELNTRVAELTQQQSTMYQMSKQIQETQTNNKALGASIQQQQIEQNNSMNQLYTIQNLLEKEKMDRIAKAQQRVLFLEQAVRAEDQLVDQVNKIGNQIQKSQINQSGFIANTAKWQ